MVKLGQQPMELGEGGDGAVVVAWRRELGAQDFGGRVFPQVYMASGLGLEVPRVGAQDLRRPKVRCPLHEY